MDNTLVSQPAVPEEISYSLKPTMVKSNKLRSVIYPTNKGANYSPSGQVVFNIPNLANSYLIGNELYFKFQVTYTTSSTTTDSTINVDNNASSFIQKIEIFGSDGALLESINQYNDLFACVADMAYTFGDRTGIMSNFMGFEDLVSLNANNDLRQGQSLTVTHNAGGTGNVIYTYCVPLLTGLFGLSEKLLPVWKLSGEIRVEITLADNATPIVDVTNGANDSWVFSDAQLVAEYLQIHDSSLIQSITPDTVVLHASSWRTFTNTITTSYTSGSYTTLPVSFRGSSAKAVLFSPRNNNTSSTGSYTIGSRVAIASDFQLNVGGVLYPAKKLSCTTTSMAEYAIELVKVFSALSDTKSYNASLPLSYYTAYTGTSGTTYKTAGSGYKNGHLFGLNLESADMKSDRILSGLDMRTALSFLQYTAIATPDATVNLNAFVLHDILFLIDASGRITSKY